MAKNDVDVCVVTYKRLALLRGLLDSLGRQKLRGVRARIIVVDNDPEGSARAVVKAFARKSRRPVVYDVEPTPGVSYVRNRALAHVRAPYFAFLDDDETAHPDWLWTLLKALQAHGADAAFGRVEMVFPEGTPSWARRFYLFHPSPTPTGTRVERGSTNNVLVRTAALGTPPLRFDPAFAWSGGEDTDFFFRLHLNGRRLIRCWEALVYDYWPLERLRAGWMCRRRFRAGQNFTRVFVSRYSTARKAFFVLKCLALLAAGSLSLPLAALFFPRRAVELLTRLCHVAGKLSALLGSGAYSEAYRLGRG